MPATSDEFRRAVIAAGLLSARDLELFWNSFPGGARPATADGYAAALVKAGRITPEQAAKLLAGMSSSVVIVAPPTSDSLAIKLVGGAFATIIAPLLVTYLVNRMTPQPDPPIVVAPQAIAPQPVAPALPPAIPPVANVATAQPPASPTMQPVTKPVEPPLVARVEKPILPPLKPEPEKSKPAPKNDKPAGPKPMPWPADANKAAGIQNDWAKSVKRPVVFDDSVGIKLALIPPGSFLMGNTDKRTMQVARALKLASELERMRDEMPQHKVSFSQPWRMGETEVTIGQFARFVEATKYVTDAERSAEGAKGATHKPVSWRDPGYPVTNDFPVTQVSWNDAAAYCNWLSSTDNMKPWYRQKDDSWVRARGGNGYRLPTEAEWEYACRAGSAAEFHFGDNPDDLDKFGWFAGNSDKAAHPVGEKKPNAWHLRDMHGNVREWCNDWYVVDYYGHSPPSDPFGPQNSGVRVVRGGSWFSTAVRTRSSDRDGLAPNYHSNQLGFRVVRPL